MQSKRQQQVAELIRRNFSVVLQQEGSFLFEGAMVTVTNVSISPDLREAKIYCSIYNAENKERVLEKMERNHSRLKNALAGRIRRHVKRIPEFRIFNDDTLDEMDKLNELFDKLYEDNQMGEEE